MAPNSTLSCILAVTLLHLLLSTAQNDDALARLNQKEKLTHLRLYWHDIQSGGAPTSVPVVKSPTRTGFGQVNMTRTGFGQINMIDNPLTLGPELGPEIAGRAQGFYALASQEEIGLLMTMNFFLTEGKYNGSTITILGRNAVLNEVREMPVIGGSGLFRFARGYAEARTHTFDLKTGDATVEYNVYVMHY